MSHPRIRHQHWCVALATFALVLVSAKVVFAADLSDTFARALNKGPLYSGLAAFGGGLLASLTPCVYPMIGVTVAVFGARQTTSTWKAMALSTVFVLGIAALYTPLGVSAGLTGSLFGAQLGNRWVVTFIAVVFVLLALSMFGAFEFLLPSSLTNRASSVGGVGYLGSFLLGLVSGIICCPCTGPIQAGILLWIGKTQNPWTGGLIEFLFSLGLGVPFWLVGTFALRLPKSGAWMNWVKSLFGIGLLVGALYFLKNAFPVITRLLPTSAAAALLTAIVGLVGGAVHLSYGERWIRGVRKTVAIGMSVIGLVAFIAWYEKPSNSGTWLDKESAAINLSRDKQLPMVVDFTADWCAACKELARVTFGDPNVSREFNRFVLLKVDATNDDDPAVVEIQKRYNVRGLPTVIVFDSQGQERLRYTTVVEPSVFFAAIQGVR